MCKRSGRKRQPDKNRLQGVESGNATCGGDIGLRSQMTLQVHDELLFDVVPAEADEMQELVKVEMESAATFSVPIVAEVGLGQNWRDLK